MHQHVRDHFDLRFPGHVRRFGTRGLPSLFCRAAARHLLPLLVLAWLQFSQCSFRFSDATFLLGGAPFFFVGYLVRCGG
jgi:hypothetical protein